MPVRTMLQTEHRWMMMMMFIGTNFENFERVCRSGFVGNNCSAECPNGADFPCNYQGNALHALHPCMLHGARTQCNVERAT